MESVEPGERLRAAALACGTLSRDAVAAEVVTALRQAGIPSVLLKGPVLARWLYDPGEVRPYIDVDLLVPSASEQHAGSVLTHLGFNAHAGWTSAAPHAVHGIQWHRPRDTAYVDLHVDLPGAHCRPGALWPAVSSATSTMEVAGVEVTVPGEACRALIVALHALHHGRAESRPLEDLARAVRIASMATWEETVALASALGVTAELTGGLRLLPEGVLLAGRLGLDSPLPAALVLLSWDLPQSVRSWVLLWSRLNKCQGWGAKVRLALAEAVPSPDYIRALHPSAAQGQVALVAAYLGRVRESVTSLPAAVRQSRRARTASGGTSTSAARAEVLVWSGVAWVCLPLIGLRRTLRILDAISTYRGHQRQSGPAEPLLPPNRPMVGKCLARAAARSTYLRRRRQHHDLVLGVARGGSGIAAHAWLEPHDQTPPGYVVVQRIER